MRYGFFTGMVGGLCLIISLWCVPRQTGYFTVIRAYLDLNFFHVSEAFIVQKMAATAGIPVSLANSMEQARVAQYMWSIAASWLVVSPLDDAFSGAKQSSCMADARNPFCDTMRA